MRKLKLGSAENKNELIIDFTSMSAYDIQKWKKNTIKSKSE